MSDLSELIVEQRSSRSRGTPAETRKDKRMKKRGPSKPGGIGRPCGCRWMYSCGAWRHVTPCRSHELHLKPATDTEMQFLGWGAW